MFRKIKLSNEIYRSNKIKNLKATNYNESVAHLITNYIRRRSKVWSG